VVPITAQRAAAAVARVKRPPRGLPASVGLGVASLCLLASGCGGGTAHAHTRARTGTAGNPAEAAKLKAVSPSTRALQARADVSADAIIAEGKIRIAQGAPSDAEVRREIKQLRKAGIALPQGNSAAAFENAPANELAASGAETPTTSWNPLLKPIAGWIIPVLQWASQHGWHGTVTSGYRTYFEQAQLNAAGAFSARAGLSNHETTVYPGGAVDVTQPGSLLAVLRGYPGPLKLVGGVLGPVDPEHFSATGD
jgi:hypothetical protein